MTITRLSGKILVISLLFWAPNTARAQNVGGSNVNSSYDAFDVIAHLLKAAYPDLADHQALATIRVHFDGGFSLEGVDFELLPCRMSGVSTEPSPIPYCGSQSADAKPFFNANIDFTRDNRILIQSFVVSGTFIDDIRIQKVQEMRQGLPKDWDKEEALDFLRSTNPQYGPEHRKEFTASLPIKGIQEVTGCRLNPESANFDVNLRQIPRLQFDWSVHGAVYVTGSAKKGDCWATFEPFAGRLTAMATQ